MADSTACSPISPRPTGQALPPVSVSQQKHIERDGEPASAAKQTEAHSDGPRCIFAKRVCHLGPLLVVSFPLGQPQGEPQPALLDPTHRGVRWPQRCGGSNAACSTRLPFGPWSGYERDMKTPSRLWPPCPPMAPTKWLRPVAAVQGPRTDGDMPWLHLA